MLSLCQTLYAGHSVSGVEESGARQMGYRIQYAYFSLTGHVRSSHEDNLYIENHTLPMNNTGTRGVAGGNVSSGDSPLIGVFDGMGGESRGEAAAFIASDTMRRMDAGRSSSDDRGSFLDSVCHEMNLEVCRYAREHRIRTMGTTCVCILFSEEELYFANIGDSRIYHCCGSQITQLTTDQVMRSIFYSKPPLTQYLGMEEEEMALLPQIGTFPIKPRDRYLLCTDGVTDMLLDSEIADIIQQPKSPEACLKQLEQAVLNAGAADNATAILCSVVNE